MMKRIYLLFTFLSALLISCSNNQNSHSTNDDLENNEKEELNFANGNLDTLYIDIARSEVKWIGSKTIKSHNGTIPFKEGFLVIQNGQIASGTLKLDMTKIEVLDLEGEDKERLTKKLEGEEFFKVSQFPTTNINLITSNDTSITVDLTILGKSKRITSPFKLKKGEGSSRIYHAELSFDRTNWGIIYGSGTFLDIALDKAINDKIDVEVNIVTR